MEKCSINYAMEIINGKWKLQILWHIGNERIVRFNDLQRKVNGISSLMLSKNLKELEADGLVIRRQYNEVPPRVEYELAELSQDLFFILKRLGEWGEEAYQQKTNNQTISATKPIDLSEFCNRSE
ncbi:MAG: winged helix-turn-helix transcriptional regulator [Chitinophagales bacterium]